MKAADELALQVGVEPACGALNVPRGSYYRWKNPSPPVARERAKPPRTLPEPERKAVLETLRSERFVDCSVREVYFTLLDEEKYLASPSTMHRILAASGEAGERRRQRPHRDCVKPELLATRPNQVWSWDITKLKGPAKWSYFYLYVVLDIFSRHVVGWLVAREQTATLAERLIRETCEKQEIVRGQLTIHSDRGKQMTAKTVSQMMADLGIVKTHSRPYTSNDNPFSESQFRTLKYCPEFPPEGFGCQEDVVAFCRPFFRWYNTQHRHSGIGYLPPEVVHYGSHDEVIRRRQAILSGAFQRHPERFVRKHPAPPQLPEAVWINPPLTPRAPAPAVIEVATV